MGAQNLCDERRGFFPLFIVCTQHPLLAPIPHPRSGYPCGPDLNGGGEEERRGGGWHGVGAAETQGQRVDGRYRKKEGTCRDSLSLQAVLCRTLGRGHDTLQSLETGINGAQVPMVRSCAWTRRAGARSTLSCKLESWLRMSPLPSLCRSCGVSKSCLRTGSCWFVQEALAPSLAFHHLFPRGR